MKKRISLVVGVLVFILAMVIPFNAYAAKAADKFMEKYFPNGIEKIKPEKLLIDTSDTGYIGAIVKQNDDILKMNRDYEACEEYVDYQNDYYNDNILKFCADYGINAFGTSIQFDISVDGGDW